MKPFESFSFRSAAVEWLRENLAEFNEICSPEFVQESFRWTDNRSCPGAKFSISANVCLWNRQSFPASSLLFRTASRPSSRRYSTRGETSVCFAGWIVEFVMRLVTRSRISLSACPNAEKGRARGTLIKKLDSLYAFFLPGLPVVPPPTRTVLTSAR